MALEGRLDDHGFSGLRLRTTRERDATRSHAAMRSHCTTEDEPGAASYCMFVQPEKSLDLFAVVRQVRALGGSAQSRWTRPVESVFVPP